MEGKDCHHAHLAYAGKRKEVNIIIIVIEFLDMQHGQTSLLQQSMKVEMGLAKGFI